MIMVVAIDSTDRTNCTEAASFISGVIFLSPFSNMLNSFI